MNGLRDLLADIAAEARPYDMTDRAIRTVRRRRRVALAAPLAAAALVVVGLLASLPLRPSGEEVAHSDVVSWLPNRLRPATAPAALPSDRGVAPAALAYSPGAGRTTLLTEDGRHYRMPGEEFRGISPDGRWLVARRRDTVQLRDLATAEWRTLSKDPGAWIVAWSPGSRWLAMRTSLDDDSDTTVVELPSGRALTVPAGRYRSDGYGHVQVCGLRDSAELLLCAGDEHSARFRLWTIDSTTGRQIRHDTVDLSAALTAPERNADWVSPPDGLGNDAILLADGRTLLLRTRVYLPEKGLTVPGDALAVDVERPGAAARRYALPASVPGREHRNADNSISYDIGRNHFAVAASDEGLLLAHVTPRPGSPGDEADTTLKLLDLVSGRLLTVMVPSAPIDAIRVRGQTVFP